MFRSGTRDALPPDGFYTDRFVDTPVKKHTQEEQDAEDEQVRRKATKDLVQSWMDRLQLISLITTFFASVVAGLLQTTTPGDPEESTSWQSACNACLLGALVMHVNASFVSFIAAFFLIRYKLKEANKEELQAEGILPAPTKHSQPGSIILDMAAKHITGSPTDPRPGPIKLHPSQTSSQDRPVWSTNPHLVQMGPFRSQPPIQLLSRLHSFCILMAALGFILTMAGIVCYTWAMQPRSVSIFTTACVFVSLGGGGLSLLRENDEHTVYA